MSISRSIWGPRWRLIKLVILITLVATWLRPPRGKPCGCGDAPADDYGIRTVPLDRLETAAAVTREHAIMRNAQNLADGLPDPIGSLT